MRIDKNMVGKKHAHTNTPAHRNKRHAPAFARSTLCTQDNSKRPGEWNKKKHTQTHLMPVALNMTDFCARDTFRSLRLLRTIYTSAMAAAAASATDKNWPRDIFPSNKDTNARCAGDVLVPGLCNVVRTLTHVRTSRNAFTRVGRHDDDVRPQALCGATHETLSHWRRDGCGAVLGDENVRECVRTYTTTTCGMTAPGSLHEFMECTYVFECVLMAATTGHWSTMWARMCVCVCVFMCNRTVCDFSSGIVELTS